MNVVVDGVFWGIVTVYTNERNSHKAFVARDIIVEGLPAGTHTIRLEAFFDSGVCNTPNEAPTDFCTSTNDHDFFSVTVLEIPD